MSQQTWQARVLAGPPLIAPARHIVLPQAVPGEEDAMARGALWIDIKPATGANFLVQCALGFAGSGVATGLWPTPHLDVLLAIAGGYGYRINTIHPEPSRLLPLRPIVSVYPAAGALVLTGFHALYILEAETEWESPRLSWEGLTITTIEGDEVHGTGWHMRTDRELPFTLNLRTRDLTGGAFLP